MSTTEETAAPETRGLSWTKLLRWSAIVAIVVTIFVNIIAGFIPPLLVFVVLWIVGLVWLGRSIKGPAILFLITFVAHLLLSAPFAIPALTLPESAGDFITTLATLLASITGIVAAVALLRRLDARPGGAAGKLAVAALALFVIGSVYSVIATAGYEDATLQEGDVELTAEGIEWTQESLVASSGEVAVFVDNADPTLHTFTIDELDVDLDLPASSQARITFTAEPGTYEFYCEPHRDTMTGTLTVE